MAERLFTVIGSGTGSQMEYTISVENGRIIYATENDGHQFLRKGPQTSSREISLEELQTGRGSKYYEETKTEVERQVALMQQDTNS